ncbi:ABC transporter ATP-binding protein [Psittacicella hinzii]|uniref:ABC-type dipeptide transporter n=1 Tax=Psittacicella hinzii TaxID=2028575 RepID=A0A3A1YBA3_9GAMM|nr:ABC transporter ATP-binding protein [Psittacicella hinzii]RIY34626.1 hypothetical protein CKF58_08000 [Psittacicella hinzii]
MNKIALAVKNLKVTFGKKKEPTLKGISYEVEQGQILGVVGESGSGKSISSLAILDLLDKTAKVEAEQIQVDGIDFLALSRKEKRAHLGKTISIIFQDALNALDPTFTIGEQMIETLELHDPGKSNKEYRARAIELLVQVGITEPESRLTAYPHQLSGGQLQRIMIAMVISSNPKVLIADEPTTALDVIIQNQIVELLLEIQHKTKMTLIFISHNLALISEIADKIIVMRRGEIVETGSVADIFLNPQEDYTLALINSLPQFARNLQPIRINGKATLDEDKAHG